MAPGPDAAPPRRSLEMPIIITVSLAVMVAHALEGIDESIVKVILDIIQAGCACSAEDELILTHKFAVRVQMALVSCSSAVAEPMGRCIDAALAASADGQRFKPWASTPLPGLSLPQGEPASLHAIDH